MTERRVLVQQFVDKYPQFAPGWLLFSRVAESSQERLKAIERGLAANPDRDTKGMLLLNKAMALDGSGDGAAAVELLRTLSADPESTHATEALAKAMLEQVSNK